ncbi:MAG TPA: hypothetical protein VNT26_19840, partial [Candidatus Sulfotelmatobacter sp.]|nr:hypothetical protein [Candidatus Sulfotelmatobacter sp.]
LRIGATLALIPAAIIAFSGCSSEPKEQGASLGTTQSEKGKGQSATMVAVQHGEPGGVVVQTYQETAKVSAIDKANRKVTLVAPDGTKTTVKAGPEVVNFDQIQVGDQVKATVTEQLVVFVRKSSEATSEAPSGDQTTVALAPVGAKPGVMMADTVEVTGKVTAIDLDHRKATVQFPDGRSKTFKVRDDVDLTKRSVGEEVVLRSTEAVAIMVEKP